MKRTFSFLSILVLLASAGVPVASASTPKPGQACSKSSQNTYVKLNVYVCLHLGNKYFWSNPVPIQIGTSPTTSPSASPSPTPTNTSDSGGNFNYSQLQTNSFGFVEQTALNTFIHLAAGYYLTDFYPIFVDPHGQVASFQMWMHIQMLSAPEENSLGISKTVYAPYISGGLYKIVTPANGLLSAQSIENDFANEVASLPQELAHPACLCTDIGDAYKLGVSALAGEAGQGLLNRAFAAVFNPLAKPIEITEDPAKYSSMPFEAIPSP